MAERSLKMPTDWTPRVTEQLATVPLEGLFRLKTRDERNKKEIFDHNSRCTIHSSRAFEPQVRKRKRGETKDSVNNLPIIISPLHAVAQLSETRHLVPKTAALT